MDFIEEVKYWVSKAREADPELKVFGASKHKYSVHLAEKLGYQFDHTYTAYEVAVGERTH